MNYWTVETCVADGGTRFPTDTWVLAGCYGTLTEARRRREECREEYEYREPRIRRKVLPPGYAVIGEGLAFVGA